MLLSLALAADELSTYAAPLHLASFAYDLAPSSSLPFGRPGETPPAASHSQRTPRTRSKHTYEERCEWRPLAGPSYVDLSPPLEPDRLLPTFPLTLTAPTSSIRQAAISSSAEWVDSTPLDDGPHSDAPPQLDEQLAPAQLRLDSHVSASPVVVEPAFVGDYLMEGAAGTATHSLEPFESYCVASELAPAHAHGPLHLGGDGGAPGGYGAHETAAQAVDVVTSGWAAAYAERFEGAWYAKVLEPCEGSAPRAVAQHSSACEAHLEYSSLARACGVGGGGGGGASWSSR